MALAFGALHDIVSISATPGEGDILVKSANFDVPSGEGNVAYAVASHFLRAFRVKNVDLTIEVRKGVPPGLGLGSSAATSAAVAMGLASIFGVEVDEFSLIKLAGVGEGAAAGEPHYDNVAASLFGGIVILDVNGEMVLRRVPKVDVPIAVVSPHVSYPSDGRKTEFARKVLPKAISLSEHVKQSSALAKLIYAIMTEDLELMGQAVSTDHVVEPRRAGLIPYYYELKRMALGHGCLGFGISGAGPSVFLIHRSLVEAERVGRMLTDFLTSVGVSSSLYVSTVSREGAVVIQREDTGE